MNIAPNRRQTAGLCTVLTLILGGCAGVSRDNGPSANYVPDASYHLLMAEIALERSEYLTVAQEYLSAAELSADPELAQRAAEYALDLGYDVYAERAAARWADLAPNATPAHEILGKIDLRRHAVGAAQRHFEAGLGPIANRSVESYVSLGDSLAGEANPDVVTAVLVRLSAADPDSGGARLALAAAALRSGEYDLALASARRAQAAQDRDLQPDFLIARALFAAGRTRAALEHLDGLRETNPNLAVELEYTRLMGAAGRTSDALDELELLSERFGQQPEFIRLHALISLSANDLGMAADDFAKLLAEGYNVYECFYYLGQIASETGDPREAIRLLTRIRGGAYLVPAQLAITEAYTQLGDLQTALNHLTDFVETYPAYSFDLIDARARLLQGMERHVEALQLYNRAVRFRPDNPPLLLSRGTVLEQLGRVDAAVKDMERAVEVAPINAASLNTLGYTLANRSRRHEDAYRLIRRALEIAPDSAPIIDSMGWVLFKRGRLAEALSYLRWAYDEMRDPEIAAHLGEVLWTMGDAGQARAVWQEALLADPDSRPLNETMERLVR